MITFVHMNPISIDGNTVRVDRKFHTGMTNYAEHLRHPLATVHPLVGRDRPIMDSVELPIDTLPYEILPLSLQSNEWSPTEDGLKALERQIAASQLVVGYGYGSADVCHRLGVRYIACLEYDLQTQVTVAASFGRTPVHAVWAALKCTSSYFRTMVPAMRRAHEVHCNGYPMYSASAKFNSNRLLYLDSRMSSEMVIPLQDLQKRLQNRRPDALKLIFSGRYENMKGALDAVKAALLCRERGMNVELDCYGQGSLGDAMRAVAAPHRDHVRIHDTIPFPELVLKTREADLFVCCHIQSDPSCTYLETMGSGVPIVGYANRMWSAMAKESGAGVVSLRNTPSSLADAIASYHQSPTKLDEASMNARTFAVDHCFEKEFSKRTDAINNAMPSSARAAHS